MLAATPVWDNRINCRRSLLFSKTLKSTCLPSCLYLCCCCYDSMNGWLNQFNSVVVGGLYVPRCPQMCSCSSNSGGGGGWRLVAGWVDRQRFPSASQQSDVDWGEESSSAEQQFVSSLLPHWSGNKKYYKYYPFYHKYALCLYHVLIFLMMICLMMFSLRRFISYIISL